MGIFTPYIKEEWIPNIKSYQYKSVDESLLYNYVSSPLCNKLVKLFPQDVAPNFITLLGLMCNIAMTLIVCAYTGIGINGDIPDFAIVVCAVLYVCYYLLDILDGKHARNTGNSSPLGLLMDHGCDSLTTFLLASNLGTIVRLQTPVEFILLWLLISIPFFLTTLEEYLTNTIYFPCINGVSEGTILVSGVMIFTSIIGQDFWLKRIHHYGFLRYNQILLYSTCIFSCLFIIMNIVRIFLYSKNRKCEAFSNLIMFLYMIFSLLVVAFYSKSELILSSPKFLLFVYGFSFSKIVGHMQLAHLASSKYDMFKTTVLVFLFFIGAFSLFNNRFKLTFVSIDSIIIFFLVYNFLTWFHFSFCVSGELCEHLDLYRFSIKKGNRQAQIK